MIHGPSPDDPCSDSGRGRGGHRWRDSRRSLAVEPRSRPLLLEGGARVSGRAPASEEESEAEGECAGCAEDAREASPASSAEGGEDEPGQGEPLSRPPETS